MSDIVVADQQSVLDQERLLLDELTPEECILIRLYRDLTSSEQEFMRCAVEGLARIRK